ncbi:hypothetical protein H311_01445 [Anncaliia algerae PRA109]|nr:hypothetical protein H311_01445 [Anncaliia algerae PRA109]
MLFRFYCHCKYFASEIIYSHYNSISFIYFHHINANPFPGLVVLTKIQLFLIFLSILLQISRFDKISFDLLLLISIPLSFSLDIIFFLCMNFLYILNTSSSKPISLSEPITFLLVSSPLSTSCSLYSMHLKQTCFPFSDT